MRKKLMWIVAIESTVIIGIFLFLFYGSTSLGIVSFKCASSAIYITTVFIVVVTFAIADPYTLNEYLTAIAFAGILVISVMNSIAILALMVFFSWHPLFALEIIVLYCIIIPTGVLSCTPCLRLVRFPSILEKALMDN